VLECSQQFAKNVFTLMPGILRLHRGGSAPRESESDYSEPPVGVLATTDDSVSRRSERNAGRLCLM
jgi:hypothetical protein